jgi:ankyrin repeat protein
VSPNLANQFSWTLLMLAAMEGDICIGELFVSRGAVLDTTNDFGETALSLAAHAGHLPFTRLLLSNGASMNCHPHGHSLEDWIRFTSGLPKDKIESVLALLTRAGNSTNPAEHLQ